MDSVLEQLVRSPRLKLYVDELSEVLRHEAPAREKFREDLDEDIKAEFINGEIVMHSPARHGHTTTLGRILKILDTYSFVHSKGQVLFEKALCAFTRNDYEPDICFWLAGKADAFTGKTRVYPPPDFVVEVLSESTEHRDRGLKFEDYAAHGVQEYWIVDAETRTIEQYILEAGRFTLAAKMNNGSIQCRAIEGLELTIAAAFDDAANLELLRRIVKQ